eukprot:scaffold1170_cov122-Cylindrotheca_fusiformis.AAC.25
MIEHMIAQLTLKLGFVLLESTRKVDFIAFKGLLSVDIVKYIGIDIAVLVFVLALTIVCHSSWNILPQKAISADLIASFRHHRKLERPEQTKDT